MEEMFEKVRAKGSSDNVDVRKRKASGCADYSLQHHSSHNLETEVEDSCGMVFKSNPKVDKNVEHLEKILDLDNQSFAHTLAYEEVIKMFLKGIQSAGCADIVNISRCSGSIFKDRMELFQKQLEITKKYRGDANVRYAWLPSSKKALSSVMACGLGLSKFESFHGIGLPLAAADFSGTSAKICDVDEDGVRHMILCRVIMGKMELINPGSNYLHPSNETFDSGVDDLDNPHQYTVWSMNLNTHICPEFVVSFTISLAQEGVMAGQQEEGDDGIGTTIGFLKFDEGFAVFSDSRITIHQDDLLMWTYKDNRKKCYHVSKTSNLLYLSSGYAAGNEYFIFKLLREITNLEDKGNIVGIEEAVRVAHTVLKGHVRFLKNGRKKIGGILFGQGSNQEYNAYLLSCNGDDVPEPVPEPVFLGDRPFFAYGGGAYRAVEKLEVLKMDPLPTLETCLVDLANMALFVYLKTSTSGGLFKVFFLKKGHDLNKVPDHIIDPVTNHKNRYTMYDGQVLLLIVPREHGEYSFIERMVPFHWNGVKCSSRLTDIDDYRVYRAAFENSDKADAVLKDLSPSPEKESRDSRIPSCFGHYVVPLLDRSITMYVSVCSEESLQFVEDHQLQVPVE